MKMTDEEFTQLAKNVVEDRIRFDPAQCRFKRGRVWLPRLGWVHCPEARPLLQRARLVSVSVIRQGEDWMMELQAETDPQGSHPTPDRAPSGSK